MLLLLDILQLGNRPEASLVLFQAQKVTYFSEAFCTDFCLTDITCIGPIEETKLFNFTVETNLNRSIIYYPISLCNKSHTLSFESNL